VAESNSTKAVHSTEAFTVSGTFTNQRYDALQACQQVQSDFSGSGSGEADSEQMDMSNNFEACECRPLYGKHAEHFDDLDDCSCDDSCLHTKSIGSPEEDLDRRIAENVEKTISDILGDIFDRCISSSLKSAIQL